MPNVTVSSDVDSMLQAADYSAVKTLLSLNNVQNTALTTWTGAGTLATVGTLTSGATGAGFTVALGTSTVTGVLPAVNFATGTPDGSKFLRDDQVWTAIPGGGDALTANPLSQFAATTSAQLASVLSDENGSGGGFVRATSPTLTTPTISGALTRPDVEIVAANAIGALAIDVTKALNTKSIAADSTFTFSATPAAGTSFSLLITETGGVARVVTIPSSFSVDRQTTITTMSLGANAKAWLTWYYDGAAYQLVGDSSPNAGLATGFLFNTTGTGALTSIASTGTGSVVLATSPTLVTPLLGTPTSGTLSNCTVDGTNAVGFRTIPQNSQSAAYTTVLADNGKHLYHPSADTTARTFTIDSNANVAYPIGTALTFVNDVSAGVLTIAITTDTMVLFPGGTTGSRTLAAGNTATALKVTATRWIISGTSGLT